MNETRDMTTKDVVSLVGDLFLKHFGVTAEELELVLMPFGDSEWLIRNQDFISQCNSTQEFFDELEEQCHNVGIEIYFDGCTFDNQYRLDQLSDNFSISEDTFNERKRVLDILKTEEARGIMFGSVSELLRRLIEKVYGVR